MGSGSALQLCMSLCLTEFGFIFYCQISCLLSAQRAVLVLLGEKAVRLWQQRAAEEDYLCGPLSMFLFSFALR